MVEKLQEVLGVTVPLQFEPVLTVIAAVMVLFLICFFADMLKLKNAVRKYGCVPACSGLMVVGSAFPAFASETSAGTLTETLDIFSEVFSWFLKEGGNLLSWMLGKPIILLSLSVFFVGAVVGMLSRIYSSF